MRSRVVLTPVTARQLAWMPPLPETRGISLRSGVSSGIDEFRAGLEIVIGQARPAPVSTIGLFAAASANGSRPSATRASLIVRMPLRRIARQNRLLRLRIDRGLGRKGEFEIGTVKFLRDDIVDQAFTQARIGARPSSSDISFCVSAVARFICCVSACGETEKAKQMMRASHSSNGPLRSGSRVCTKVLATPPGTNFAAPAAAEIAVEIGVPIFLVRRDLVRRPILRHADEAVGNISLREIIEQIGLTAERNIDASSRSARPAKNHRRDRPGCCAADREDRARNNRRPDSLSGSADRPSDRSSRHSRT